MALSREQEASRLPAEVATAGHAAAADEQPATAAKAQVQCDVG